MSGQKKLQKVVHDSLSLPPEKIFTVPTCMSCRSIVLSTKLSVKLIPASWSLTLSAHFSWIPSLTIILLWMFSENVYASKLLPTLLTDSPEIQYADCEMVLYLITFSIKRIKPTQWNSQDIWIFSFNLVLSSGITKKLNSLLTDYFIQFMKRHYLTQIQRHFKILSQVRTQVEFYWWESFLC